MIVKLQTPDRKHDHFIHDVYEINYTGKKLWIDAKIKDSRITTVIKIQDFYITIYDEGKL